MLFRGVDVASSAQAGPTRLLLSEPVVPVAAESQKMVKKKGEPHLGSHNGADGPCQTQF
jgi:hypothetical protein